MGVISLVTLCLCVFILICLVLGLALLCRTFSEEYNTLVSRMNDIEDLLRERLCWAASVQRILSSLTEQDVSTDVGAAEDDSWVL